MSLLTSCESMMGRVVALAWRFRDWGTCGIVPASQLEETPFPEEKPDQIGLGGECRVGPSVIDMQNPASRGGRSPCPAPAPNSRPIRPERLPADERATGLMQAIEWNSTSPKTRGATGLFPSQDGSIQGPTAQGQPLTQNGNDMIG